MYWQSFPARRYTNPQYALLLRCCCAAAPSARRPAIPSLTQLLVCVCARCCVCSGFSFDMFTLRDSTLRGAGYSDNAIILSLTYTR